MVNYHQILAVVEFVLVFPYVFPFLYDFDEL